MNPSESAGYIPLGLEVLQVSRAHPIPGVPGISYAERERETETERERERERAR